MAIGAKNQNLSLDEKPFGNEYITEGLNPIPEVVAMYDHEFRLDIAKALARILDYQLRLAAEDFHIEFETNVFTPNQIRSDGETVEKGKLMLIYRREGIALPLKSPASHFVPWAGESRDLPKLL